jgi:signal transduction histidine kinase
LTVQWPAASNPATCAVTDAIPRAIPRAIPDDVLDAAADEESTVPPASNEALPPAASEQVRWVRCTVRSLTAPPPPVPRTGTADSRTSERSAGADIPVPGDPLIVVTVEDQSEVRALQDVLTRISDEERRRMGEDMHDLVASRLTIMSIRLQNLQNRMRSAGDQDYAASITPILDTIQSAASRVRAMSHALCPVELKDTPLSEALDHLVSSLNEHHRPDITFNSAGLNGDAYPPDVRLHVFRIAHEAVHNAIKHARASWIRVDLSRVDGRLTLSVWDDGVGVTAGEWDAGDSSGIGQRLMQCRADMLGATLSVDIAPNGGTILQLDWPIHGGEGSGA